MRENFTEEDFINMPVVTMDFLTHHIFYTIDRRLNEMGITYKQSKILVFMYLNKDVEINQGDIEKFFHLKPSTVSSMIATLERKEWIVREKKSTDNRTNIIKATDKGIKILSRVLDCMEEIQESYFAKIPENEKQITFDTLRRISRGCTHKGTEGGDTADD